MACMENLHNANTNQFLEIHSLIVGRYFWIILECIIGCFCIEKCMAVYGNYMFNRQLTVNGDLCTRCATAFSTFSPFGTKKF